MRSNTRWRALQDDVVPNAVESECIRFSILPPKLASRSDAVDRTVIKLSSSDINSASAVENVTNACGELCASQLANWRSANLRQSL